MHDWETVLRVRRREALLLTTCEMGDVLKARLPLSPQHPRALVTLLEGWRCGRYRGTVEAGSAHRHAQSTPAESMAARWQST